MERARSAQAETVAPAGEPGNVAIHTSIQAETHHDQLRYHFHQFFSEVQVQALQALLKHVEKLICRFKEFCMDGLDSVKIIVDVRSLP